MSKRLIVAVAEVDEGDTGPLLEYFSEDDRTLLFFLNGNESAVSEVVNALLELSDEVRTGEELGLADWTRRWESGMTPDSSSVTYTWGGQDSAD